MPDDVPVLSSQLVQATTDLKDVFMKELSKLTTEVKAACHTIEGVDKRVSTLTTRVQNLGSNPP
jgi:hypothetical protein